MERAGDLESVLLFLICPYGKVPLCFVFASSGADHGSCCLLGIELLLFMLLKIDFRSMAERLEVRVSELSCSRDEDIVLGICNLTTHVQDLRLRHRYACTGSSSLVLDGTYHERLLFFHRISNTETSP